MSGQDGKRDPDPRELAKRLEECVRNYNANLGAMALSRHLEWYTPVPVQHGDFSRLLDLAFAAARELRSLAAREAEVEELRAVKDGAYHERNQLVALLSANYPSQLQRHPDDDLEWEDDWRWIVFVQLPTGQASWHIHDDELPLFDHLPRDLPPIAWDGHTTPEKYERVIRASVQPSELAALRERVAIKNEVLDWIRRFMHELAARLQEGQPLDGLLDRVQEKVAELESRDA